jgi:hypothetical protein
VLLTTNPAPGNASSTFGSNRSLTFHMELQHKQRGRPL